MQFLSMKMTCNIKTLQERYLNYQKTQNHYVHAETNKYTLRAWNMTNLDQNNRFL